MGGEGMGRRCVAAAAAMVILIHLRRAFVAIPNSLLRSYPRQGKREKGGGRSEPLFLVVFLSRAIGVASYLEAFFKRSLFKKSALNPLPRLLCCVRLDCACAESL